MIRVLLTTFAPGFFVVVGVLPILAVGYWRRVRLHRERRTSPLWRDMLRPAGYSVRNKLDELNFDIDFFIFAFTCMPLAGYAIYVSQSHFLGVPDSAIRVVLTILLFVALTGGLGWWLSRLLRDRQRLQIGMEGEMYTGQALDQLMLEGARVFHDIPFDYGNIDHVVVSPSGVYSVNTKTFRKPTNVKNNNVVVDHGENVIRFPDWTQPIPNKQLLTERDWLAKELNSAVGERVVVEPILALPGWYIERRIGRGDVYVLNPVNAGKFFVQNRSVLSPAMIQRISHQLDRLCRDVEPSFREDKGWEKAK